MKLLSLILGSDLLLASMVALMFGAGSGLTVPLLVTGVALLALFGVLMSLNSLLGYCCWNGHRRAAKLLLAAGAEADSMDNEQMTPLMKAVYGDHTGVVELLLAAGADVNDRNADGETALMIAASRNADIVKLLLAAGARANDSDFSGGTALMHGVCVPRSVAALLAAGADVQAEDSRGWSALRYAEDAGAHGVIPTLLRAARRKADAILSADAAAYAGGGAGLCAG